MHYLHDIICCGKGAHLKKKKKIPSVWKDYRNANERQPKRTSHWSTFSSTVKPVKSPATSQNIKAIWFHTTALIESARLNFKDKLLYYLFLWKKEISGCQRRKTLFMRDFNLALNYRNSRMWCGSDGQAKDKHVAWQGEDNKCCGGRR